MRPVKIKFHVESRLFHSLSSFVAWVAPFSNSCQPLVKTNRRNNLLLCFLATNNLSYIDFLNLNVPGSFIHPFCHSFFRFHCRVPFSLHTGNGKCCMWLVDKVEILRAKIDVLDCKWPNMNDPGSYILFDIIFLGFTLGCPFPCIQEKRNAANDLLITWKYCVQK